MDSLCLNFLYIAHFMDPLGQNVDTAVVTGDVIRAEVLWTDTEGRYVPLFLQQLQWYLSDISSNVSWQWYCEDFHLWSNQVRISDMLWTCSIFPWAAGGYGTKYSMLFDIIRWVYEQDITNEQMDFIIRYWDGNTNKVAVRYLGSEFLGHTTAVDLLTHFKQGISQLDPKRLLQVSMDGPNVNWKFYTDLTKERNSEELPQLLNIGSCGLHIVHGGLQKGVNESGWKLGHLMRSLWQLFHDTAARRKDFVKLTGSTVFPLKLCPHRWVEDVVVAERAHQMWPNIKKFVSSFRATPKKAPQTASYATIKEACEDPLTVTKLEFFISVAKQLQPFLLKFQTDAPMAPFLGSHSKTSW